MRRGLSAKADWEKRFMNNSLFDLSEKAHDNSSCVYRFSNTGGAFKVISI
jgi:hypothetical protein